MNGFSYDQPPSSHADIDVLADRVQNCLVSALEAACPIRKHKAGSSVPYYSSEDKKQRTITRRTFNGCKKTGNFDSYYKELRTYKKHLRLRERSA